MINDFVDISEIEVPEEYLRIWKDISLEVQERKARNYNLSEEQKEKCFSELQRRPYYLCLLAETFGAKNIAEVGTAEGLQSFSFANLLKDLNGHVWTCDIKDVRNKEYSERHRSETTFVLGNSESLASEIEKSGEKIDLFYIDGAHDYGDVIRDVFMLKSVQSENPIWVFDDYDERFGCYEDINMLIGERKQVKIYRVGNAASGNPNHQVIVRGRY